jgi:serine/threonine protein phosphatase 1
MGVMEMDTLVRNRAGPTRVADRFLLGLWRSLAAFFRRRTSSPATSQGTRIYAIGDIHGRLDLVQQLLRQLEADVDTRGSRSTRIVLLGDLIDRGPYSRQVLELARLIQRNNRGRVVVLCGNHEELLLASADGHADAQRLWLECGGDATLRSYGLDPVEFAKLSPEKRAFTLQKHVGPDLLCWLAGLPTYWRNGDYFFCHAGVRPGVPLEHQRREDLLWIRREFLDSQRHHGAVVVHGHSEVGEVDVRSNRIGVDTSAYRSGELTAVGLQDSFRWFISTAKRYLSRSDLDSALARAAEGEPAEP